MHVIAVLAVTIAAASHADSLELTAEQRYERLLGAPATPLGLREVHWDEGAHTLSYEIDDALCPRRVQVDLTSFARDELPCGLTEHTTGESPRILRPAFPSLGPPTVEIAAPDGVRFLTLRGSSVALRDSASERVLIDATEPETYFTTTGSRWSSDSRFVAVLRVDARGVHHVPIVQWLSGNQSIDMREYPQAKGAMLRSKVFIVDTATGRNVELALGDDEHYVSIAGFRGAEPFLWVLRMTRDHRRTQLMLADARTGELRVLLTEESPTWLYGTEDVFAEARFFAPLPDGRFLWSSERDGWNQLYLYTRDGRLERQLTRGDTPVVQVVRVDGRRDVAYYLAHADPNRPYDVHLMRVGLGGGPSEQLTREPGIHEIRFSPNGGYFLDSHSSVDRPPVTELRSIRAGRRLVLERTDVTALTDSGWQSPQEVTVRAADGATRLYGVLLKPADFDPQRHYPVIQYIYAGPFRTVTPRTYFIRDDRIRFLQALVQLGFVAVVLDARGTPGRSKAFQDVAVTSFGEHEVEDHLAALRELAAARPYMDLGRVGVFGISFGGYFAVRAMLRHPEMYRAGVALSPAEIGPDVLGAAIEPFLGRPVDAPQRYAHAANAPLAARLAGELLIAEGTSDINTPLSQTMQLVQALMSAGKSFQLLIVPETNHVFRRADGSSALPQIFAATRRHFAATLHPLTPQ
jgi:dipeptidyl aminopeptidase/acylaminoacyl peptidase